MEMQEWEEKVKNAKCPEIWTEEYLGYYTPYGIQSDIRFYPGMSNIESLNTIEADFCYCNFDLYTHGICLKIEPDHSLFTKADVRTFDITNEQIVDIDLVPYDEYIKYKKSLSQYMNKGAAFAAVANTGMVGVALGAAIGAVASIGHKTTHLKGKYLRVTFWDRETKELQYILLDHAKEKELEKLAAHWREEKRINEETGRKSHTEADEKGSNKKTGCLSVIAIVFLCVVLCSFILI